MRVKSRPIEGMRYSADQSNGRPSWQSRVGVECNHIADGGRNNRCPTTCWHETGVGGAAQQAIQFMKLSTFALPADPLSLAVVPTAPAVEKKKSLAPIGGGAMALVQPCDALNRCRQQFVVSRHGFFRRVGPVGKERATKIAIRICKIVHFQPLDLLRNLGVAGQESRYDDQGPKIRWHSVTERQPRKRLWPQQLHDLTIDQRDRQIRSRYESEKPNQEQTRNSGFRGTGIKKEQSEDEAADNRDSSKIPRRRVGDVGAA